MSAAVESTMENDTDLSASREWQLSENGVCYGTVQACSGEEALSFARANVTAAASAVGTTVPIAAYCVATCEDVRDAVCIERPIGRIVEGVGTLELLASMSSALDDAALLRLSGDHAASARRIADLGLAARALHRLVEHRARQATATLGV